MTAEITVTGNGITGGLHTTLPTAMVISAFTAIAWVNSLELQVRIWMTFKKRVGLYFWSLNIASLGVAVYALAFICKFFKVIPYDLISVVMITIGWWTMVTGQSLVLYSRLHLLVVDRRKMRWILYMICIDAVIFHLPTTVLTFGSNSSMADKFDDIYGIYEKIQMTAFCIQEFIISFIYIWETRKMLKPSEMYQKQHVRRVMKHLIYIHILIIAMDIALLGTEYGGRYDIETTMKGAIYGFKLRLEFSILNQLMAIVKARKESSQLHGFTSFTNSGRHNTNRGTIVGKGQIHSGPISPKPYSVFVGKGNEPHGHTTDNGIIKTTTEVVVQTSAHDIEPGTRTELYEDSQTDVSDPGDFTHSPIRTSRANPEKSSHLSSTSEIELTSTKANGW